MQQILMCIRECLDANNMNTAIDAAFTAAAVPLTNPPGGH